MLKLGKHKNFEWDKWNIDKSYQKHGITPNETEEAFLDEKAVIIQDVRHSQKEERFVLVGKTTGEKFLFVVFAMREATIRIISARRANRRERKKYEEIT